jgi:Tol biopolymer transport system component
MGEVYRARDTKLQRDVAIKILPQQFALDPDRLARFQREAQVLASLNHPNIGAIYGLEEVDGVRALVLELVEGPTLADRIAQGPMPIDEALPIARQIAEALEAAHEHGTIHRDLKPANVKLRPDGTVKVLDFGLAKALDSAPSAIDASQSPTITSPAMTGMGVILGTAAYMSPEQAKGRQADKRSDVWAFGAVLYEMLTGRRAFEGEDISDTLAAVLRGEPEWTTLPANVSPALVALLRGCLDKDRRRRVADLSTARFIIDREGEAVTAVAVSPASTIRRAASILMAVATVAGIAAYTTFSLTRVSAPSLLVVRATIALPIGDRFTNPGVPLVALSADGTHLAYAANLRLYLRPMNQLDATPIRGIEVAPDQAGTAARSPFFSSDGRWIGFFQEGQLKKVLITGGAPFPLCAAENPWGVSWTSDNTILFGQSEEGAGKGAAGIWRVSSEGGKPEHIVKVEAGQIAHGPQLLPGGRAILFTLARRADWDTAQIVIESLDSGRRDVVVERGADARYVPTGHLVYALDGTLLAVPFDVTRLKVTGDAVRLEEDVAQANVTAHFAISNQGALVYVPRDALPGNQLRQRTLVWVDRLSREVPIKGVPPRNYFYPRLSRDGTRVALDVRDQEDDIWIWHLAGETLTRLTLEPTFEQSGVWTPDGKTVIYASSTGAGNYAPRSLFRRPSDGTGTPEQLIQGTVAQFPSTVTPDGTELIFRVRTPPPKVGTQPGTDLYLLPLAGEHRPRSLLARPFDELNAEVSPNGQWLAYESNESGRSEIYLRPFPNVDADRKQVSTNGGTQPLWARSGQELFYLSMGTVMRVPVKTGATFVRGTPEKVFDASPYFLRLPGLQVGRMYDVSADDQRFLMLKVTGGADERPQSIRIILVQNWFEELKRLVPTK